MKRRATLGAVLLVVGVLLGGTILRAPVAEAMAVLLTREQNLDVDGNIKIHEQGTANVNIGATDKGHLANIDNSTGKFSFDANGNLRIVDGSGAEPVAFNCNLTFASGQIGAGGACYSVPAGKRLVIQRVSVSGTLPSPQVVEGANLFIGSTFDTVLVPMHDEGPWDNGVHEISVGSADLTAYAGPGDTVGCAADRSGGASSAIVYYHVTGLLIGT
jgi:hypothetical protein